MMPKATLAAATCLIALSLSSTDAFLAPVTHDVHHTSVSPSALSMGKSMAMPGPAKSGSSGPATSEYRMKKMSDRMKSKKKGKNKKKGGFGGDDEEESTTPTGEKKIMDHELEPEPEGGEEVAPLVAGGAEKAGYTIRLKDLGPVDEKDDAFYLNEELGRTVHNFWMSAIADGNEIEKTRTTVLKQSAKNANFPGFRKGQIPPYAQPKMTNFALQEVLVTSCQEAITRFGVNEINEGQLGAVTFNENVEELSKKYNTKSFLSAPFTANFRATFDPEAVRENGEAEEEEVAQEAEATSNDAES